MRITEKSSDQLTDLDCYARAELALSLPKDRTHSVNAVCAAGGSRALAMAAAVPSLQ